MAHTIVNPPALHDPTPFGYSHSAGIPAGAELVLVAGQYGAAPDGRVVSDDFSDQLRQTFGNVAIVLAAHQLELRHVVSLRTYVVGLGLAELGALARTVGELWGDLPPTHTVLGVAGLATPDLRVEVEAVAVRP